MPTMADMVIYTDHHPSKWRPAVNTMKVDVTVIAEFPDGIPPNVIAKLARVTRHPAALHRTTLSDEGFRASKDRTPRRRMAWRTDGVDYEQTIPDETFRARMQVAAKYGIMLERTIRRADADGTTGLDPDQTVFWTWGEGDLMDLAPMPAR